MAKRHTASPRQVTPPRRSLPPIVVADSTEVGVHPGVLVIRTGTLTAPPTVLAVPAEGVADFLQLQQEAADRAEPDYWNLLPVMSSGAHDKDDMVAVGRVREAWLRAQPWDRVLRNALDLLQRDPLVHLAYAGHVGLLAGPPCTTARTLVIFDPLQIRRMTDSFQKGAVQTQLTLPDAVFPLKPRVHAAVQSWSQAPWPLAEAKLPTQQQAREVIAGLREDFLQRRHQPRRHA